MKWTDFLSVEKKLILNKSNIDNDKTYVGIDFGTSTTVVSIAKLDEDNNLIAEHIDFKQTLFSGATRTDYRVNSAVAYYKKKILIGTGAKELQLKLKQNINYWQSFKMQLGSDVGVAYPESEIATLKNPTDVITLFFRALKFH
jgi:molecular chaperone DnaK